MEPASDDALTEKEWREMRRRMTSLQFEPVPETPELVPRSLYGSDGGDESGDQGETARDDELEDALYRDDVPVVGDTVCGDSDGDADTHCAGSSSSTAALDDAAAAPRLAWSLPSQESKAQACEPLASSAPVVSPTAKKATVPLTAASLKSSKRRSTASPSKKPRRSSATNLDASATSELSSTPVDLADLDGTIGNAQEQLRLTILSAVHETMARHERDATLERRKLEAAHANRVALLQNELDELHAQTQIQQHEARGATQTLERATRLMMKWKQRERDRWRAPHSVRACFGAWKVRVQQKRQQHAQQQFATQFQKKQSQQTVMQQWKLMTQQTAFEKKLVAQREQHSRAIDALKEGYEGQLQQLQRELQAAQDAAAVAQLGREQLEGDLRQVFLRGVSAMNIEALTLFKTNHQQRLAQLQERGQHDQHSPQLHHTHVRDDEGRRRSHDSVDAVKRTLVGTATGGESSGELPSEERMVPIKQPTEMPQDPVRQRLQIMLPNEMMPTQAASTSSQAAMPSSVVANRLLKKAGSAEIVSTSPQPFTDSTSEVVPASVPPPTAAVHGLRSAEVVEAHQRLLHATASRQPAPAPSIDTFTGHSLSPAQQRLKAQSSMQFAVEMELMRSSVAAAVALNARYPSVSGTVPSPSKRSGSLRGPSLAASSSSSFSSARRTSSFSSSSSSTTSKWRASPS